MAKKKAATSDTTQSNAMELPTMELWSKVCRTPKEVQTPIVIDGRDGAKHEMTEVDAAYQLKQATELWGPYGSTWGLKDLSYEVYSHESLGFPIVIISAVFFYPLSIDEKTKEATVASFPILNDMNLLPGCSTMKSIVTNTRSKALSCLGFAADVYSDQDELPSESDSKPPAKPKRKAPAKRKGKPAEATGDEGPPWDEGGQDPSVEAEPEKQPEKKQSGNQQASPDTYMDDFSQKINAATTIEEVDAIKNKVQDLMIEEIIDEDSGDTLLSLCEGQIMSLEG